MKTFVTWRGPGEAAHPVLGILRPDVTLEYDLDPSVVDGLKRDASGYFEIRTTAARIEPPFGPPAIVRRPRASDTMTHSPAPSGTNEEA